MKRIISSGEREREREREQFQGQKEIRNEMSNPPHRDHMLHINFEVPQ